MRQKFGWFDGLNYTLMLVLVFVTLFPFLYLVNVSLSDPYYVVRGLVAWWPKGFTLESYKIILADHRIPTGYRNTILYTIVYTALGLMLTAMAGYALSRQHMIFRKFFTLMILFTMLFSGGMIPTFLVVRELGIIDTIWGMVLPGVISVWNLLIMRTFFAGLPSELFDSGEIDGLTDSGVFRHIVLPLSKPVLATMGLFYAVSMWNNFTGALLYIRSPDLFPLQVILRNMVLAGQLENDSMMNSADSALTVATTLQYSTIMVTTLPILLVYPFIQKYFVKGVLVGSVKA